MKGWTPLHFTNFNMDTNPFNLTPPPLVQSTMPSPSVMIVAVEGVYVGGRFVLKELAFYQPYTRQVWVGAFMAPMNFEVLKADVQRNVREQIRDGVNINFNDGHYQPLLITHILNFFGSYSHLLAVDDITRDTLLQYTTYPVSSVSTINLPPPTPASARHGTCCKYHGFRTYKCALNNAIQTGANFVEMHALRTV